MTKGCLFAEQRFDIQPLRLQDFTQTAQAFNLVGANNTPYTVTVLIPTGKPVIEDIKVDDILNELQRQKKLLRRVYG